MMRRTGVWDVLTPFVVVGVLSYLVLRLIYESIPPFQWFTALPVAVLAIAEFVIARRVRHAVRHRRGARPMTALAVARGVALGKASVLVGAAVAGAAAGLAVTVLPDANRTTAAANDLRVALVLLVATAALTVAGILLERAGIDPNRDLR
jgi:hypothetical protein